MSFDALNNRMSSTNSLTEVDELMSFEALNNMLIKLLDDKGPTFWV